MTLICNRCGDTFDEEADAFNHVIEVHPDICDFCLGEYISDSQSDAYDRLIEECEDCCDDAKD